ncbi:MAG: hypothetical protein E7421_05635 [Ruminococcaceae bacterium]|nr:hypothetical protein [Oscillospiraceae bacterium]
MKKKLLALLLVLCLIVALVPVATIAADPTITVKMVGAEWADIVKGTHKYATTNAAGSATECAETDNWNVHLDYSGATPVLYLKNATLTTAEASVPALSVTTTGAFTLNSVAGTTNTLTSNIANYASYPLSLNATAGTTVTGSGNLVANVPATGNSSCAIGTKYNLTFKDANVTSTVAGSYRPCIGLAGSGDTEANLPGLLVIDGGNVTLTNLANGRGIAYMINAWAQGTGNTSTLTSKNVTIKGGANVKIVGRGNAPAIGALGGVIVENSTLIVDMSANGGQTGWTNAELPKFPQTTGVHLVEYKVANNASVTKSFVTGDTADADYIAPGTDMTAVDSYLLYLSVSHQHDMGGDCTVGGTCTVCGAVIAPQANHVFADFEADTCSFSGCNVTRAAGLRATISGVTMDTAYGETKYATMDANGAVTLVDENAAWNIKIDYTGNVPVLALKNITATAPANTFSMSGKGALVIKNLTDVSIKALGACNAFILNMNGGTTFTSEGQSKLTIPFSGNTGMSNVIKATAGTLTFENANIEIASGRSASYAEKFAVVSAIDDVIFSGGNVTIDASGGSNGIDVGGDLIFKDKAKVELISSGWGYVANVTGDIKVDNANVVAKHTWGKPGETKWLFNKLPAEVTNANAVYSNSQWNYTDSAYQKELTSQTNILDWENAPIYYIAFTDHTHDATNDCTVAYTCSCGQTVPARAAHEFDNDCTTADTCKYCTKTATAAAAHAFDKDCTTADTCANAGCTQTATAAAAHAFDNDCTTEDKCANCDVKATKAAHVFDNDCTTADKCANCDQVATAGAHTFDADCTTDDTCTVCGNAKAGKKDAHAFDNDCTTDDTCQNAGCAVKADKKAAHAFDNDCMTADKCANCDITAVAGAHTFDADCTTDDTCTVCGNAKAGKKDAHVFDTDCTTADTCQNAGCAAKAEAKAAHAFDANCTTADTCQNAGCAAKAEAKAAHAFDSDCTTADKCANCDVKAEAGAHIFDKDCTTADKCTSCGTAATAEKAHKYTNNADTTCDNAGCEHTRVVESGDKNPQTGDNTALVLCVVVMLTAAAAFVFTKKRIAL